MCFFFNSSDILVEPNSEKNDNSQQLADCLLNFSFFPPSHSLTIQFHTPHFAKASVIALSCILYFENETENINSRTRTENISEHNITYIRVSRYLREYLYVLSFFFSTKNSFVWVDVGKMLWLARCFVGKMVRQGYGRKDREDVRIESWNSELFPALTKLKSSTEHRKKCWSYHLTKMQNSNIINTSTSTSRSWAKCWKKRKKRLNLNFRRMEKTDWLHKWRIEWTRALRNM